MRRTRTQTCFANEQVIDQLAYLAGKDPYQFRLNNISRPHGASPAATNQWQWRDALVAVAKAANWQPRVANSVKQTGNIRTGRGIALGGFAGSQSGIVAEIEVNMKSGKIVAKHMYASQVAGLTVAPALVENQMSGALIMGVSRALLRGGRVRQGPGHEPRLGHVPAAAVQGPARR